MATTLQAKAKSAWLMSFGDMVTLLITFFILMIAMNKGEINSVQKWAEDNLDATAEQLTLSMENSEAITVKRTPIGIEINIQSDQAFVKGGFRPSELLIEDLTLLGQALNQLNFIILDDGGMPEEISATANKLGVKFFREISIAGHTDNDQINPDSILRNNWFLSSMRAQNVMQILYSASELDGSLFSVAGYGEYQPVADNLTDLGKSANRRVQIVISANFEESAI